VHGREPGQENKETIATCAAAAIDGGITGIVLQPNTTPAIDTASLVSTVLEKGRKTPINVLTTWRDHQGAQERRTRPDWRDESGGGGHDHGRRRPAAQSAVAPHCHGVCEGFRSAARQSLRSQRTGRLVDTCTRAVSATRSASVAYPHAGEEICLERDIRLAQFTGAHLHLQHVSTAIGLKAIERAKNDGVHVTCEVTPHHLMFNHHHIGNYDTNYKVNPPLRTPEDNAALLKGLIDGLLRCDRHRPRAAHRV